MKLCLFLTLCLAPTVSSFLYQNSRCHEGPSYWCQDEQVAESCEATTFCRENIWSDQTQQVYLYYLLSCMFSQTGPLY